MTEELKVGDLVVFDPDAEINNEFPDERNSSAAKARANYGKVFEITSESGCVFLRPLDGKYNHPMDVYSGFFQSRLKKIG